MAGWIMRASLDLWQKNSLHYVMVIKMKDSKFSKMYEWVFLRKN